MKTLFIDFDGTICHNRFWRSLPEAEYMLVQAVLFGADTTIVQDWMRGKYTSEYINRLVSDKTKLPYDYLWKHFVHNCQTMRVDLGILEAITVLRTYYTVVLITGNMDCFSRFTIPALGLEKYFDKIVNSAEEGQLKTEHNGATFLTYLTGSIANAILIEDSPMSCEVFSVLGGTALPVTKQHSALHHLKSLSDRISH